MKFLADMGISPRLVAELRDKGHDAAHVHERGLGRSTDPEILAAARDERRILLTHDLDFGKLLAASGGNLPSVIVFRLKDMRPENVARHLFTILAQYAESLDKGAILSVGERRVRI